MPLVNPLNPALCPYCFEELQLGDAQILDLEGNILRERPQGWKKWFRVFFPASTTGRKNTYLGAYRVCPHCGHRLPNQMESMENRIIGLVGGTYSGKSTYATALIQQIREQGALDAVGCTDFHPMDDQTRDRYTSQFYTPLFVQKQPIQMTLPTSGQIEPLIYVMVFRDRQTGIPTHRINLILFDAAGEDMADQRSVARRTRYIQHAHGLIFLVDPLTIPGVMDLVPRHLRSERMGPRAADILDSVANIGRHHRGLPPGALLPIPTVITLAKSDLLRTLYDAGEVNQLTFLRDPNYAAGYQPAELQTVHDEVKELLHRYDPGLLRSTRAFSDVAYSAVSATSSAPDTSGIYPVVRPLRCVDPLLHILAKLGVIQETPVT